MALATCLGDDFLSMGSTIFFNTLESPVIGLEYQMYVDRQTGFGVFVMPKRMSTEWLDYSDIVHVNSTAS